MASEDIKNTNSNNNNNAGDSDEPSNKKKRTDDPEVKVEEQQPEAMQIDANNNNTKKEEEDDEADFRSALQAQTGVEATNPEKVVRAPRKRTSRVLTRPAVKKEEVEEEEEEEEEEKPKKKKKATTPKKTTTKKEEKKPAAKKKTTKKEEEENEEEEAPKKRGKKTTKKEEEEENEKEETPKKRGKKKKEEEEEEIYKWWEQEEQYENGQKWTTLSHNGVLFPPEYVPHGVPVIYDGKKIKLTPEEEEVATMFAGMKNTDYWNKPVFRENFFKDWLKILNKDKPKDKPHVIKSLDKCDFSLICDHLEKEKEKKKNRTAEEKKAEKEAKAKAEEKYTWAIIDGRKERVGNFRIEPPGLFRGRGEHPKMGCLKKRIYPEDVTINIGEDDKVPSPPPGHKWKAVVHNNQVTWLAFWKDSVNDDFKYVFLSPQSSFKGKSDRDKFEVARNLKSKIDSIRKEYTKDWDSDIPLEAQRATALYLIDKLALRVGNEKDEDSADTVGCCSLRVEHIKLTGKNTVEFDFLGKDSIRYQNTVEVEPKVFRNLKNFTAKKAKDEPIFDSLSTSALNKYLSSLMPKLTAKVFRTYNASITLERELAKVDLTGQSLQEKLLAYNHANKQVAILCNHQKTVSKTHGDQLARLDAKIAEIQSKKDDLVKAQKMIKTKGYEEAKAWYAKRQQQILDEWEEKCKAIQKEHEANAKKEGTSSEKKTEPKLPKKPAIKSLPAEDKIKDHIKKLEERIKAANTQKKLKDDLKTVALGTSKINYLDPRITVAWCKKWDVPIDKIFNQSLRKKFPWAMDTDENFKF